MGSKEVILIVCILLFAGSCKKKEDKPFPSFPLSNEGRSWFNECKNGYIEMKSSSGLSEMYKVTLDRSTPLGTYNGELGHGEDFNVSMEASLTSLTFNFRVFINQSPEQVGITFNDYGSYLSSSQTFNPVSPYQTYAYSYSTGGGKATAIKYIGDTTINAIRYSDIFLNRTGLDSATKTYSIEIYFSKSKGLVSYQLLRSNIWWFKE